MATLYGSLSAGYGQTPVQLPEAAKGQQCPVKVLREVITLASQATTDTIVIGKLPLGAVPLFGLLNTDTSLGTSTIAIGITGSTGKYRAAATFTATSTPTMFGVAAGMAITTPLSTEETVFITIATAALPSSGTLVVDIFYAMP